VVNTLNIVEIQMNTNKIMIVIVIEDLIEEVLSRVTNSSEEIRVT